MQPLREKGNRTSRKGAGHKGEVAFGGNRSLLMHTNVASRGGGLLPFFLRPASGGGDDGA
jgi:hypothetical protein